MSIKIKIKNGDPRHTDMALVKGLLLLLSIFGTPNPETNREIFDLILGKSCVTNLQSNLINLKNKE